MRRQHFIWQDLQHNNHFVYEWLPEEAISIKGIVQIAHGMAETAGRYERLAKVLTKKGYAVYANDHLGHGRTAGSPDAVGKFGKNSFLQMVDNMGQITQHIRKRYQEHLPLFVMGHSMGSFLTQHYMGSYLMQFPEHVQGIILSGSNGSEGAALNVGIALATAEAAIRGDHHRSSLLTSLSFGAYNKKFTPNRTSFDWLSTDPVEVDKYVDDPYCGVVFTSGFFRDFFRGLKEIHRPDHVRRVPADLPIYIFSGEEDPVGGHGKGVRRLIRMYEAYGLRNVSSKLYPGGRHEMLNEVNREEVMDDLAAWLDTQVEGYL
ncbi:alpha/beta fold hydrolase [Paenibacillus aceris]|uniref:Alpha-beta hydrolase superfamily lysophospholipase n=1 Tax=Paenibacillus aceris TaxID=869555 RepID=A0ABS4HT42_9BACL|nr:alpha/beta fold hydrolase [Paenibacillus aceris]MBP1961725.1 alpha-beta hydrolase superfamily lysophospholipase [Paenibacillus aceris]NHW34417.1 alpha/beta hydrolase [Paenibacillus aceris]